MLCLQKLNLSQSLPPRHGIRIVERLLANRHNTIPLPFTFIIVGGSVEDGAVIPDSEIIESPFEADLKIMILRDELQEICLEDIALAFRNSVDPAMLDLMSRPEE
jgi:hypothetical protein